MPSEHDADFMRLALNQAKQPSAAGDVPIGAVVVAGGELIASAQNSREATGDPTAHAEVLALRSAAETRNSWRLDDCTLYVTLEPCTMCAGAIVLARVQRLVFGAWNEEMGAVGTLWDVVRDRRLNHQPEVHAGVLAQESSELLREFFAAQRNSDRPRGIG